MSAVFYSLLAWPFTFYIMMVLLNILGLTEDIWCKIWIAPLIAILSCSIAFATLYTIAIRIRKNFNRRTYIWIAYIMIAFSAWLGFLSVYGSTGACREEGISAIVS